MKKKVYRAAVYVRLSKEDAKTSGKKESNSISNQKSLILKYLESKDDIEVMDIYVDDGYSGSTFDRPAFKEMIAAVMAGKIDCVCVKDLSRFCREYIDGGMYIERLFPSMGVRFIAINDNYDSIKGKTAGDEIIIPFKNLINDAYCRDISIKIRSHLDVKRRNGEFVGNYCPYGYARSASDHNALVVDGAASHVVQDIFAWLRDGMSPDSISRRLNNSGVPSPMEHKRRQGIHFETPFKTHEEASWSPRAVRRIAANPVYTGTLTQGRVTTPNHKVKTKVERPRDEWAVVEDSHEALVSMRDFDVVQKILGMDTRTAPGAGRVYVLSGLCTCAGCGASMIRRPAKAGGKSYAYYMCSTNKKTKGCTSHRIREDVLEGRVLEGVKSMIGQFIWADDVIRKAGQHRTLAVDVKKYEERKRMNEEEITKCRSMLAGLYGDYKDGVVTGDDFVILKQEYEKKRKRAEAAIAEMEQEGERSAQEAENHDRMLEEFCRYKNIDRLDRRTAVTLLKEVKVYADKSVEVVMDCDDGLQQYITQAGVLAGGIPFAEQDRRDEDRAERTVV